MLDYDVEETTLLVQGSYDDPNVIRVGCSPNMAVCVRNNLYTLSFMYERLPHESYDIMWSNVSVARNIDTLERIRAFKLLESVHLSIFVLKRPRGFNLYVFDGICILPKIIPIFKIDAKSYISGVADYFSKTVPDVEPAKEVHDKRYEYLRRDLIMRYLDKDDRNYCFEAGKPLGLFPEDKPQLIVYAGACKLNRLTPLLIDEHLFKTPMLKTQYKSLIVVQSDEWDISGDLKRKLDTIIKHYSKGNYDIALFLGRTLFEKARTYLTDAGLNSNAICAYEDLVRVQDSELENYLDYDLDSTCDTATRLVQAKNDVYIDWILVGDTKQ